MAYIISNGCRAFSNEDSKSVSLLGTDHVDPVVVVLTAHSDTSDMVNVNAFATDISTAGFTIRVSDSFTGFVEFRAISSSSV